jgi:hypothetical protein
MYVSAQSLDFLDLAEKCLISDLETASAHLFISGWALDQDLVILSNSAFREVKTIQLALFGRTRCWMLDTGYWIKEGLMFSYLSSIEYPVSFW